jgi:hypothetical protein
LLHIASFLEQPADDLGPGTTGEESIEGIGVEDMNFHKATLIADF